MAEPEVPLAAAGLDLVMATSASLERQLLTVSAELILVQEVGLLQQLADGAAPDPRIALAALEWRSDESKLRSLNGAGWTNMRSKLGLVSVGGHELRIWLIWSGIARSSN